MSEKESNPKQAFADNKIPVHLWPPVATYLGTLGLLDGACKYGRANWRASGVLASTYYSAIQRHINAWMEGENLDPESGLPHLGHALACLAILADAQMTGMLTDDRNYRGEGYRTVMTTLTALVPTIRARHKDKSPKHYDKRDEAPFVTAHETAAEILHRRAPGEERI